MHPSILEILHQFEPSNSVDLLGVGDAHTNLIILFIMPTQQLCSFDINTIIIFKA